ncbi:ABC transporter ATP-binding protein [Curvibacter sp. CHRR-16]|nr:ABC transporter ATP-binding protein [Curvibacter sp. CHRR-16]
MAATPPQYTIATLRNLTVSYHRHPALHHLHGHLQRGTLTAVVGPNGAGKSTLLKTLAGLLPFEGELALQVPRQSVAYLPQAASLENQFPISVRDCVLLGSWQSAGAWGRLSLAQRAAADRALQAVGLQGFEQRLIGSLSGGQFQRMLFARLMMQEADLILLDEPFNAVDTTTTAALMNLLHQWRAQGRCVVAVLHDDHLVAEHFDQTILLARECVAWGKTRDTLTTQHWQRARAMAEAWDEHAADCQPGTAPVHAHTAQEAA